MTIERRRLFAIAVALVALSPIRSAGAQVHWDAGIQAGVTERLTTGPGVVPTPGPSAEVHAHIAVLPMLRVGPYAGLELSPAAGTSARRVYSAGLRAKLSPPWLSAPWHAWAFLGVGFADGYTPGYLSAGDVVVRASSVAMLELPVGVGSGYKSRGPWELYAELGARVVLAHGSIREVSTSTGMAFTPFVGDDLLAVSLSVGVSLSR